MEQHSCFSYQCNLCSRILVRTGPHQQLLEKAPCPGKPSDALLIQRQSGIKGKEAEKLYTEYKEKTLPTQWEEYLDTSVPKPVSPLKTSPLRRSRLSTPKKRKRDSTILRDFKNAPFYILCLFHMINLRMFSLSFFIFLQNGP